MRFFLYIFCILSFQSFSDNFFVNHDFKHIFSNFYYVANEHTEKNHIIGVYRNINSIVFDDNAINIARIKILAEYINAPLTIINEQGEIIGNNSINTADTNKFAFGYGDRFNDQFKKLEKFNFSQVVDKTAQHKLENKQVFSVAINSLKQEYKDDDYIETINKYLPNTGIVEDEDHLEKLITSHLDKGIVFKLGSEGFDGGEGHSVLVLTPEKLAHNDQPLNYFLKSKKSNFNTVENINKALANKNLIWQEYIQNYSEPTINFTWLEEKPKIALVGEQIVDSYGYIGNQIFRSSDAIFNADQFEEITHLIELLINKIFIIAKVPLSEKPKYFGADLIANEKKIVITEINPRLTGISRTAASILKQENKNQNFFLIKLKPVKIPCSKNTDEVLTAIDDTLEYISKSFEIDNPAINFFYYYEESDSNYIELIISFYSEGKNKTDLLNMTQLSKSKLELLLFKGTSKTEP